MVIYGKDGYSDVMDPRQANARGHADVGGKVTGVHLTVHVLDKTEYRCTNVYVVDEEAAQGGHTAFVYIRNRHGQLAPEKCVLLTGYDGSIGGFDDQLLPGNDKTPVEHTITNKFAPPNLGPLAIALVDDGGGFISDVVGNLGLPHGHHVSFVIEFEEREAVSVPGRGDGGEVPSEPSGDGILEEIRRDVKAIRRALGV